LHLAQLHSSVKQDAFGEYSQCFKYVEVEMAEKACGTQAL